MAREATVFPQAIGVAATFRPELNAALADAVRLQMRAIGAHHGLSPVLDVCRDPRWGRTRGDLRRGPAPRAADGRRRSSAGCRATTCAEGVVATAKHFVGYGASEGGLNWAPAHLPDRELRDVYLHPFEAAVRTAGLASVMNGYHELDGVPCAANRWLLTDDPARRVGIRRAASSPTTSPSPARRLPPRRRRRQPRRPALALHAGHRRRAARHRLLRRPAAAAVDRRRRGHRRPTSTTRVRRVLRLKFRLGLFERPYVDAASAGVHTRTPTQIARSPRRSRATAWCCCATTACCRCAPTSDRRGDRPQRRERAQPARRLRATSAHVESLLEMLSSGRNVFAMPLDRRRRRSTSRRPRRRRHGARRRCGDAPDGRRPLRSRAAASTTTTDRVRRRGRARPPRRRRRARHGRQGGAHRRLHDRRGRDVASLDLPGCAGGARPRRARHRHAGRARARRRPPDRLRGSCTQRSAAVLHGVAPRRGKAAPPSPTRSSARQPRRQAPDQLSRAVGPDPGVLRPQGVGRALALEGRLRRPVERRRSTRSGTGSRYTTFELVDPVVLTPTARPGDSITRVGVVREHRAARRRRGRPALRARPAGERDASGARAPGLRRVAVDPGSIDGPSVRGRGRRARLPRPDRTYVVEPGEIEVFVGTSSPDLVRAGTVTVEGRTRREGVRRLSHGHLTRARLDARDEARHRVDRLRPREALPADERAPRLELERVPDRGSDALAARPAL